MNPDDGKMLRETYRLSQENNKMLHKMRRSAFWGGLIKFFIYVALLGIPIWLYLTYLMPVLQNINTAVNKVQGTSASVQTNWSELWKQFQDKFSSPK